MAVFAWFTLFGIPRYFCLLVVPTPPVFSLAFTILRREIAPTNPRISLLLCTFATNKICRIYLSPAAPITLFALATFRHCLSGLARFAPWLKTL